MKLKKFEQFLKEDLNPIETEESLTEDEFAADEAGEETHEDEFDSPEDLKRELGEEELGEEDFDEDDTDDLGEDEFDQENNEDEFEEEEEGHEYEGTKKLKELANKLGAEVVNNQIDYNGQKINYYSETEKFHIGKNKFSTVQEVLDFLNPQGVEEKSPEVVEEEDVVVGESFKYLKKFGK
jgi:hypothetical protein